jgi:HK97 family phage prohead protease
MIGEVQSRSMPLEFELRDTSEGLTMTGLVVPWMQPIDPGDRPFAYREQFARGSFDRAIRAPIRVPLMYGHTDSFDGRLGFAAQFRDSAEGLIGDFRLDRSRAEHARDVLESSHRCLSVGFVSIVPRAQTERAGELVTRMSVHLAHVAACEEGAYPAAGVLTVRGADLGGDPTVNEVAYAERMAQQKELLDWLAVARNLPAGYSAGQ